jgi:pilus assembly protein CpaE
VVAALKQDIAVMVPNSSAVPASINRGVPIVLDEPKHPVSVALRDLSERFVRNPDPAGDEAEQTRSSQPRRRSLLSRGGSR